MQCYCLRYNHAFKNIYPMWLITIFIYLFFVFKFCMNIKKAKFIKRFYTLNCDHVFVICFSCARFDRIIDLLQPD